MKNTSIDPILLWMHIHRKSIAVTLILIMIASVALGVGLSHKNEVMQTAKAQMAYEEQKALLESEQAHAADIEAHLNTFLAAIDQEDYPAALNAIDYVIENDSPAPDYYLKRAGTYVLMENYDEAMNDFNESLHLNSDQPDVYALMGQIHMQQENYTEAVHFFGKSLELSDNQPEVYYNKAICHMLTAAYSDAAACMQKVIQSDCDDTLKADAQAALDSLVELGIAL